MHIAPAAQAHQLLLEWQQSQPLLSLSLAGFTTYLVALCRVIGPQSPAAANVDAEDIRRAHCFGITRSTDEHQSKPIRLLIEVIEVG